MDSDDLRWIGRGLLRALANPRRGGYVQMKIRACLFGLIGIVSLTSGCACCDNPCWGFRLHPFHPCGSCCPPTSGCSPAYSSPVVYRPPTVVSSNSDCPCNSTPVIHHPAPYPPSGGYPQGSYPPIIGNPMPLPGVVPGVGPKDMTTPGKN